MKIDMDLEDTVHFKQCVIEMKEDTERPDLSRMLAAFQEDPNGLPQRVIDLFKKYDLIDGNRLTDTGKQLVENGIIQMPEYGTYQVAFVDSKLIGRCDDEGIIAIKRMPVEAKNYRRTDSRMEFQAHDVDRENKIVSGKGRILTEQESFIMHPFEVNYRYDSETEEAVCQLETKINWTAESDAQANIISVTQISLTKVPKIDPESIKEGVLPGYDKKFGSVMVDNFDAFEEDDLLAMKYDTTDHPAILESCQKKIKRFSAKNVPLMSSDDKVITQWMLLFRKKLWSNKFLSLSEAEDDQRDWLNKIAGKEIKKHILKDDKLFENLNGSRAFWNVAAMNDLSPTQSVYRCTFYVYEGDDDEQLRRNLFKNNASPIDTVYIFDRYVAKYTPEVLRRLVGPDVKLVFVIPTRKSGEIGSNGLDIRQLPEGCQYREDTRKWTDTHDRLIVIRYGNGDVNPWFMTNSIDHLQLVDDKIRCDTKMRISPEYDLDPYIEGFVEEGSK